MSERWQQEKIFTKTECDKAWSRIQSRSAQWRRQPWPGAKKAPFFSFGFSAYSTRKTGDYVELNKIARAQFWEDFSPLYLKLRKFWEKKLKAPVRFRKDGAYPGFHILLDDSAFVKRAGLWHMDLDFQFLKWTKKIAMGDVKSFTIPLSLPKAATSLEMMNLHAFEIDGLSKASYDKLLKSRDHVSIPHKTGHILIHDGLSVHRIGGLTKKGKAGEARVTLQGQIIRQGKHWEIFW